jgi:hypothetical protein
MIDNHKKYISDIFEVLQRIKIYAQQVRTFQDYAADIYTRRGLEREFAFLRGPLGLLLSEEKEEDLPHSKRVFRLLEDIEAMDDTVFFDLIKKYLGKMEEEIIMNFDKKEK